MQEDKFDITFVVGNKSYRLNPMIDANGYEAIRINQLIAIGLNETLTNKEIEEFILMHGIHRHFAVREHE